MHRPASRSATGLVAALAIGLAACSSGQSASTAASTTAAPSTAPPSAAAATATPEPTGPATFDIQEAGAARISMGGDPDWLALAGGYVYVAADTLHLLDGTTGADQGRVNIGGSICLAMDVGFDSLWVPSCGESPSVTRVDPTIGGITATIPIDAIDLQPEGSVAAGAGGVWVITAPPNQVLVRIDPAANAVAGSFSLPTTVDAVRASDGALWITSANGGSLLHVDPDSGEVIATIPIGGAPRFLAVGEGGVWVMDNLRGAVVHVNPTTDTIVATIDVGGRVDGGDIAVGGGYVWARVTDGLLVQIDPATDRVVARYGPASGSGSVAADDTAVWVSAHDVSTIWRLPLGN